MQRTKAYVEASEYSYVEPTGFITCGNSSMDDEFTDRIQQQHIKLLQLAKEINLIQEQNQHNQKQMAAIWEMQESLVKKIVGCEL